MQQTIFFTKMHSLGNDFIVIDAISQKIYLTKSLIQQLADRHTGIGCDQVLLLEPPTSHGIDFGYRIFNADGSQVAQCANGARCLARFAHDKALTAQQTFQVETASSVLTLAYYGGEEASVTLPPPSWESSDIPLNAPKESSGMRYSLPLKKPQSGYILSMGNPHCIIPVSDLHSAPLDSWAQELAQSQWFPEGINVSVMQVMARNSIRLRTYERGVGETLACGSAAAASVASGLHNQEVGDWVRVEMPGGSLDIARSDPGSTLTLTGITHNVFEGHFVLNHE